MYAMFDDCRSAQPTAVGQVVVDRWSEPVVGTYAKLSPETKWFESRTSSFSVSSVQVEGSRICEGATHKTAQDPAATKPVRIVAALVLTVQFSHGLSLSGDECLTRMKHI